MKLSDTAVKKFNKYFKEMLEHYKLTDMRIYTDKFNGLEVFLYRKEFLDEYFKVQEIFNPKFIAE